MCYISVCKKNKSQNLIKSNFKSSWWLFLFYHYFSTKLKEILAKQKIKIFEKEIDQKMKKYYIELLPRILDFKIELKKLKKYLI
ncbi:hypothetical protein [Spiroplasma endosymbiont of Amphimallon solstitiale]|uniref:hypothetical protein n=1 Tax=Spiroplasma endosymbiont of Amphimallon solstitiale TaxID=3066288 RepID=UPI00313B1FD4